MELYKKIEADYLEGYKCDQCETEFGTDQGYHILAGRCDSHSDHMTINHLDVCSIDCYLKGLRVFLNDNEYYDYIDDKPIHFIKELLWKVGI